MSYNKAREYFKKEALSGAKKICARGTCSAPYPCDHTNKEAACISAFGKGDICPLAKYGLVPEKNERPYWQIPDEEVYPTNDEFFALCANCSHANVKQEGSNLVVEYPEQRIRGSKFINQKYGSVFMIGGYYDNKRFAVRKN